MKPETATRLLDAQMAATELQHLIAGHTAATFVHDRGLQLVAHELLEIVGEALNGVRHIDPDVAERVPHPQRYLSLRHRITDGYGLVDSGVLWRVADGRVPALIEPRDILLEEALSPDEEP